MPPIVEKDGHQRPMGEPQYKRLKGQKKLNGFTLVKNVSYAKPGADQVKKQEPDKITLPEEVTKFQQKTVAEREQDALNKAYVNMGEKGLLFQTPEDYTGDPALLKISTLPTAPAAPATPAAETEKATPAAAVNQVTDAAEKPTAAKQESKASAANAKKSS